MKKWYFRERNYRTLRESVIPTKKAPQKVLFIKWGGLERAVYSLSYSNLLFCRPANHLAW